MRERRIPRHVPVVPDDGVDYSELLAVVGVHEPVRNLGEVGPAVRQGCVTERLHLFLLEIPANVLCLPINPEIIIKILINDDNEINDELTDAHCSSRISLYLCSNFTPGNSWLGISRVKRLHLDILDNLVDLLLDQVVLMVLVGAADINDQVRGDLEVDMD